MVLGFNLGGVGNWFSNTGSSLGKILFVFLLIIVIGILVMWWYSKNIQKKQYTAKINVFKIINGKKFWISSDLAKEIVVPGTNVRLLFWKEKKIYSAYPTRSIGFNVYAYIINRLGELTNFDLGEGEDPTEAKIDYDHRDQTYAYLNLQEFINRNYKKKDQLTWWQQHIGLITIVVVAVLLGLEMWFFFSQSGKQLVQWTSIAENFKQASETIANAVQQSKNLGSGIGVVPVA